MLVQRPDGRTFVMSAAKWQRYKHRKQCSRWSLVCPAARLAPATARASRPRVVHVAPWDLTVGGMQRMLDLWCRSDGHRWEVHIISPGDRGPFAFSGATVHARVEARRAEELLGELAPDLLVHHGPATRYGRYSRCPCVWIVHGMAPLREPAPQWCRPAAVFSNLDSREMHPSWRTLPLRVLSLGVDLTQFRPRRYRLVCGIVGRLSPEKVPAAFVEHLRAWRPGPWTIRFIGQGAINRHQPWVRERLRALDWIEFVGDVEPDALAGALRELDAVMVPTDADWGETGCYSAVEALACGVPVICRDVEGLRASCGEAALYATTDAGLLSCLRQLDDPARRAALGQLGRQVAERRHDLANHVAAHSRAFCQALAVDISVLVAVYNTDARHIGAFWESLVAQTCRAWELVLVDDGSTDAGTIAELDRLAADPRVRLVRLPENRGLAVALNAGLAACRADLVARMDADDLMLPERLARQLAYLRANPAVDILGAQIEIFDDATSRVVGRTAHPEVVTQELIAAQAHRGSVWFLNHPAVMFRKAALVQIGGYPERYPWAQDLDCWLRAHRAGLVMRNLPEVLVRYRRHPAQISSRPEAVLARTAILRELLATLSVSSAAPCSCPDCRHTPGR